MTLLRDYAAALTQPTLPISPGNGGMSGARYDEVIGPDGALRAAWKGIGSTAANLTSEELRRLEEEIARSLVDDGVTYGHPDDGPRPWRLDPMPLVLDAASWRRLETGLAQRAELLNAVLADVYGAQRLLADGAIPASVIVGHPGFIRAVARPSAVDAHPLLLSATDLGRDADGEWRVLADRVQAPSGLGYAMANRRVIARLLPELYQDAELHRLDPYFAALRDALLGCAEPDNPNPRVVVLSPGTHSETSYDQGFIAHMLGFPLVQGSDLVVRDGAVWIKPPRWPKAAPADRVDVILRRVDAPYSDPLELRGNSRLGVAGLVEAVRRGRVRVVNGLGAGVLENPALLPFLPALSERLLGEQLRIPSTTAWWCGDPTGVAEVLHRLETDPQSVIVRTIDGALVGAARPDVVGPDAATSASDVATGVAAEVVDGAGAAATVMGPDELRARILAEPYRYVGLERLPLSQAPTWGEGQRVHPRSMILRTFTVRHRSVYRPMMGGMATLFDEAGVPLTKDVWVIKADPEDADQGLSAVTPLTLVPSIPALAPRALEDMFWAGRYAERAEDLLRLVVTTHAHLEQRRGVDGDVVPVLLGATERLAGRRWLDPEAELRSLIVDADRRGSAAQSLAALRTALEGVRDQMSSDTWRVFGLTDRALLGVRESGHSPHIAEFAGRALTGILSFQGVTANMIRDTGWHMIEAGRYLERSMQLCTLLAATTTTRRGSAANREVLDGVLVASESLVTHRRRYRGYGRVASVFDLLLTDLDNPRSLGFSLEQLRVHLSALPDSTGSTRPERLRQDLADALNSADIAAMVTASGQSRPALELFLLETAASLRQLAQSIADLHFAGGPLPQLISSLSLVEETGVRA
ncbi:circularly permuted type 2 ATP-grasp protein [Microbacterium sp. P02]|uniref:circularly permuted type 2 ATP-grasp protein n=1 Tax=Microbacterium sp. P02 TaxID=3366260 RepID=UPI00366C38C6